MRRFFEKIVVDVGVGRLSQTPNFEEKALVQVMRDIADMTGQAPERPAKKSIAGFKIRENQIVGVRVTLRRDKMVDFFERLVNIVLPRVRDFCGSQFERRRPGRYAERRYPRSRRVPGDFSGGVADFVSAWREYRASREGSRKVDGNVSEAGSTVEEGIM